MERKITLGIVALATLAILGISVIAAQGFPKFLDDDQKLEFEEQRMEMQEAIANNDFGLWKSLHEERMSKMQSELTEENFNKMVERHQQMEDFRLEMEKARESGDYSKIQELKQEFGVGQGKKMSGECQRF